MCSDPWIAVVRARLLRQTQAIEQAAAQLSDAELARRAAEGFNAVAVIMRHLAGNLLSRWTGLLDSDGEKPDRDREREFEDWPGSRADLMARWEAGWAALLAAVEALTHADLDRVVRTRAQPRGVREALIRALDDAAGHAGQVAYLARLSHAGEWRWLSIPPGQAHDRRRA